jgi:hypothetical protein
MKTETSAVEASSTVRNHALSSTEASIYYPLSDVVNEESKEGERAPRRSRFRRARGSSGGVLTTRDGLMLDFLERSGGATLDALQDLCFGAWPSRAQARMRTIFDLGYVRKVRGRLANEPDVFYVPPSARTHWVLVDAELKSGERRPRPFSRPQQIEQIIMMSRFFARLLRAAQDAKLFVSEWQTERELRAHPCFDRVVPDGYIRICRDPDPDAKGASFLLESEARASNISRWHQKFASLVAVYESGGYEKQFGTTSLRILVLLSGSGGGPARLRALTEAALQEEATMVRLARWDDIRTVPARDVLLEPLWLKPGNPEPVRLFAEVAD